MNKKFNTGVEPYKHDPPVKIHKGMILRGTLCIPFDCEDVPDGSKFLFASDYQVFRNNDVNEQSKTIFREMSNTTMISKYACFLTK